MNKLSFEAPIDAVVDQYGFRSMERVLALVTSNTTPGDLEALRSIEKNPVGLFVNFGKDNARKELFDVRGLCRSQNMPLVEVHIPSLAFSFLDREDKVPEYNEATVINMLHGIAADFALYNGVSTVHILEDFGEASVFHVIPQYYFALNQQLEAIVGSNKIKIHGKTILGGDASNHSLHELCNRDNSKKLILSMLSGGPDSTVLLSELVRNHYQRAIVEAVFINFGQPYMSQELISARKMAALNRTRLNEVMVPGISHAFVGKGEKGVGYPILRNLINSMYGLVSDYARYRGADEIHHANIKEDVVNLPWLQNFFEAFTETVRVSSSNEKITSVKSEYLSHEKAEVIMMGSELIGEKIAETFSCLTNGIGGHHCGKCRSCRNRRKAFMAAQVEDATEYEVEPEVGEVAKFEPTTEFI